MFTKQPFSCKNSKRVYTSAGLCALRRLRSPVTSPRVALSSGSRIFLRNRLLSFLHEPVARAVSFSSLRIKTNVARRASVGYSSPASRTDYSVFSVKRRSVEPDKDECGGVRAELANAHLPGHRGNGASRGRHAGLRVRVHRLYIAQPDPNPRPDPESARQPGINA